jgi:hypothetical protein
VESPPSLPLFESLLNRLDRDAPAASHFVSFKSTRVKKVVNAPQGAAQLARSCGDWEEVDIDGELSSMQTKSEREREGWKAARHKAEREAELKAEHALKSLVRKWHREEERNPKRSPLAFSGCWRILQISVRINRAGITLETAGPKFFPKAEYEKVDDDFRASIRNYPHWVNQIWKGDFNALFPLLGIEAKTQFGEEPSQIPTYTSYLHYFFPDWQEGVFRYHGICNFQRDFIYCFSKVGEHEYAKGAGRDSLSNALQRSVAPPIAVRACSVN